MKLVHLVHCGTEIVTQLPFNNLY